MQITSLEGERAQKSPRGEGWGGVIFFLLNNWHI